MKMDALHLLNDYNDTKDCIYKGEHYSVRDNGAVLRHSRENKRKRKDDDIWTFGKVNEQTGYLEIGSERVHRIVACAFLGEPPTSQHVVDHIDTNRRNNRPQNLRWLTKLENVLNNPITKKKIEYLCGSIETFINNPSIIQKFANNTPNFGWMRTVTQAEARASYERLRSWATLPSNSSNISNGKFGEWIYTQPSGNYPRENNMQIFEDNLTESLTDNAMQRNWKTPTEFPLCPAQYNDTEPLVAYLNRIGKGSVVTKNQYSIHYVDDSALHDNTLFIKTHADEGLKKYSLLSVTFEHEKFVHEGQTFFEEQGAQKAFILAQGLEWNGEEGIDDFC